MVIISYKIYPTPDGEWRATWQLTSEQSRAAIQLGARPSRVKKIFFRKKNEKAILAKECEGYAGKLSRAVERDRRAYRLKTDAPIIKYGIDDLK